MSNNDFDIDQVENRVIVLDRRTHQMQRVDPVTSTLDTPARLPAGALVSLGQDTVVVANPATGAAWSRPFAEAFGVEYSRAKPDLDLGAGGLAVAGADGRLFAVSVARGELISTGPDGNRTTTRIPFPVTPTGLQLSVVAGQPVLLDRTAGLVWVEGRDPIPLGDAASAQLQAPSAAPVAAGGRTFDALVGTGAGLVGVTDDEVVVIAPASGTPSRPVVVGGCGYGAWAAGRTGSVVRLCSNRDAATPVTTAVPSLAPNASLVFRVNRDEVVLNAQVAGNVWPITEQMKLIVGWDKVTPPKPEQGDDTSQQDTTTTIDPNRTDANRRPDAVDDTVSARAGRSTELPLLDNDSDPDGDILTFAKMTEPAVGARAAGGRTIGQYVWLAGRRARHTRTTQSGTETRR